MSKALYISGPMTGYPELNYTSFNEAAEAIRNLGFKVVNPAEHFDGRTDLPRHKFLAADVLALIQKCNGVVLLPGWQHSEGARLEAQIGSDLGYEFYIWTGLWKQLLNLHLNLFPANRIIVERALA